MSQQAVLAQYVTDRIRCTSVKGFETQPFNSDLWPTISSALIPSLLDILQ
jgi:hypothetical protein